MASVRPARANRTGTQSRQARLTAKDVTALEDKTNAPDIVEVAPVVNAQATATYNGATHQIGQGVGTTPNYFAVRNFEIASWLGVHRRRRHRAPQGRRARPDRRRPTCSATGSIPSAQKIKIGGSTWTVIGVLKSKGIERRSQDQDDIAIAPITSVQDSLSSRTARLQPDHGAGEVTRRL